MTSTNSPWDDIRQPSVDLSSRQVETVGGLKLFRAKDQFGHCLFLFEFEEDGRSVYKQHRVRVNGLAIDLRESNNGNAQILVLKLEEAKYLDVFHRLCEAIVELLTEINDSLTGLSVALMQIKQWQAFLESARGNRLSKEAVRGLFCELEYLRTLINDFGSEIAACNAWTGPDLNEQDFIFGDNCIEIKSILGGERNRVRISSEDQLETVNTNLYLKVYRLVEAVDGEGASLNSRIRRIIGDMRDVKAIEIFQRKLQKLGYVDIEEYDSPEFLVAEETTYRVEDEFPRIVRSELAPGLAKVSYEILLESISSFKCLNTEIKVN